MILDTVLAVNRRYYAKLMTVAKLATDHHKSHVTIDGTAEAVKYLTIRTAGVVATPRGSNDGRWSAELDPREGSNAFVVQYRKIKATANKKSPDRT